MNARPFSAAFLTLESARKVPAIVDVLSRYRSLRGFERYGLVTTSITNSLTENRTTFSIRYFFGDGLIALINGFAAP